MTLWNFFRRGKEEQKEEKINVNEHAPQVILYFKSLGTDNMNSETEKTIRELIHNGIPPWYFRTDFYFLGLQLGPQLNLEETKNSLVRLSHRNREQFY